MLTITIIAELGTSAPPDSLRVDLAVISPADARRLHGQRVTATITAGKSSFTWNRRAGR